MRKITSLFASLVFIIFNTSAIYAASTAHTYGFSARGIAMGNAMCAIAEDWSSVFYNTSGLGKTAHLRGGNDLIPYKLADDNASGDNKLADKICGEREKGGALQNQLALGYLYTLPQLKIDIDRREADNTPRSTKGAENLNYGAFVLGVAVDLNNIYKMPSFISSARFGFGMMSNGDGTVVKINDASPKTHNFLRYGREAQRAVMLAGIGTGFLNDSFGIGFGANLSFGGQGKVKISNVDISSETQTPEGESRMDMKIEPTFTGGIYIRPGRILNLKFLDTLELGFTYRQASELEIYPFETYAVATGNIPLEMVLALYDYYTPETYILGFSYSMIGVTLSLEVEYQRWSKFKVSSANYINFPDIPKMNDIFIPKAGVSYAVLSFLEVMAGYYYQPGYVPDKANKGEYNFLDNDKHVGSAGIRFFIPKTGNLGGAVELNLAYQYQYLVPKKVTKDDQTNTLNPNYEYGGIVHTAMFDITMRI